MCSKRSSFSYWPLRFLGNFYFIAILWADGAALQTKTNTRIFLDIYESLCYFQNQRYLIRKLTQLRNEKRSEFSSARYLLWILAQRNFRRLLPTAFRSRYSVGNCFTLDFQYPHINCTYISHFNSTPNTICKIWYATTPVWEVNIALSDTVIIKHGPRDADGVGTHEAGGGLNQSWLFQSLSCRSWNVTGLPVSADCCTTPVRRIIGEGKREQEGGGQSELLFTDCRWQSH